jgi:hypothetical protein
MRGHFVKPSVALLATSLRPIRGRRGVSGEPELVSTTGRGEAAARPHRATTGALARARRKQSGPRADPRLGITRRRRWLF